VTGDNNVLEEITNCLRVVNISYFGLQSQLKSQLYIYKTHVRPLLTYATETWTMTKMMKEHQVSLKEKSFTAYMVQYAREGSGRKLEELCNEPNIVNIIKSNRLRCTSHIVRMDEN
jgi:hypothetical protein